MKTSPLLILATAALVVAACGAETAPEVDTPLPVTTVEEELSCEAGEIDGSNLAQLCEALTAVHAANIVVATHLPLMWSPQEQEALGTLEEIVAERGSRLEVVGRDWQYIGDNHQLTPSERMSSSPPSIDRSLRSREE